MLVQSIQSPGKKQNRATAQRQNITQDIRKNAEANSPKRAFRARHSQKPSQNERFVRDIRKEAEAHLSALHQAMRRIFETVDLYCKPAHLRAGEPG